MRIYWIDEFDTGNLGMMARPRGNDWLEDEIRKLELYNVNTVTSFLEKAEEQELGLSNEKSFCQASGINFISFPIEDRNVPKHKDSFLELVSQISELIKRGKKVVLHCRMGIGRTSIVAAGVLIKHGIKSDVVFDLLSKKRTLTVPDTQEQISWIKDLEDDLKP